MATTAESVSAGVVWLQLMLWLVLLWPQPGSAAEWKVAPSLELKETYSNNVNLATQDNAKADYITQLNPGVRIDGKGPKLQLHLSYLMQNIAYAAQHERNTTHHHLNASAASELVDDYVFLDAYSGISQQARSPLAPFTLDNSNSIDDRSQIISYSVSPYLRHDFGTALSSELRYTRNGVNSNAYGLPDSMGDNVLLRLENGSSYSTLGWTMEYRTQHVDYLDHIADTGHENYFLTLSYPLGARLRVNATGGYEKYDYLSIKQMPEGNYWLAGFDWKPGERTQISANGGKRFWGDSYAASASHRGRRSVVSLGYHEDISETRSQFLMPAVIDTANFLDQLWQASIPDAVLRQQLVQAFMLENDIPASLASPVNFLSNRVFLQKRLQAAWAISGARNSIIFNVFNVLRESQTAGSSDSALLGSSNIALSDHSKQHGSNLLWNLKLSSSRSLSAGIYLLQNDFPEIDKQALTRACTLTLHSQLQADLNATLGLRHNRRESTGNSDDYLENAVTASLRMQF